MTSINENQLEKNRDDLRGREAVAKIQELVRHAKTGFLRTSSGACPMNVRQVDDQGVFWFLSPNDSRHNRDLATDADVELFFQGSAHSNFLHIRGQATILTDRSKIEQLWEPLIKTWFTGGVDDPRITVIRVAPEDGYYWDTKHGEIVAFAKMMIGSVIGKTLDDSIEGTLRV